MQTFLPYRDFAASAKVLDNKRLGKQRVEGMQIVKACFRTKGGWVNHPATKMWRGSEPHLLLYVQAMIDEWVSRGFKNTIDLKTLFPDLWKKSHNSPSPEWLSQEEHISKIELSHKSNLLKKMEDYYSQYNWDVPNDIAYHWPVK